MQAITEAAALTTEKLEQYIDSRYEASAPQDELEVLETQYAARVSEDDLNMTEEEPNMQEDTGEGTHLEENLVEAYRRYLQPDDQRDGRMTKKEVIVYMRAIIEDSRGINKGMKYVKNADILAAAQDVYEYKRNLVSRYRARNKLSIIPRNLRSII